MPTTTNSSSSIAERLVGFDLPPWRKRSETLAGIRADIARHLRELPPASHLFVAEDEDGERLGFLHLQTQKDFFTGVAELPHRRPGRRAEHDGQGVGSALVAFRRALGQGASLPARHLGGISGQRTRAASV